MRKHLSCAVLVLAVASAAKGNRACAVFESVHASAVRCDAGATMPFEVNARGAASARVTRHASQGLAFTEGECDGTAHGPGLNESRPGLGSPSLCAEAAGTNGWRRVCLFPASLPDNHLGWAGGPSCR